MFYQEFKELLAGSPGKCLDDVREAITAGKRGQIFGHLIAVLRASPETLDTAQKLAVVMLIGYLWSENGIYRFVTNENAEELAEAIMGAWSDGKDIQPVIRLRMIGGMICACFHLDLASVSA